MNNCRAVYSLNFIAVTRNVKAVLLIIFQEGNRLAALLDAGVVGINIFAAVVNVSDFLIPAARDGELAFADREDKIFFTGRDFSGACHADLVRLRVVRDNVATRRFIKNENIFTVAAFDRRLLAEYFKCVAVLAAAHQKVVAVRRNRIAFGTAGYRRVFVVGGKIEVVAAADRNFVFQRGVFQSDLVAADRKAF